MGWGFCELFGALKMCLEGAAVQCQKGVQRTWTHIAFLEGITAAMPIKKSVNERVIEP